jgi:tetrahydromethanopterin S-methyltransferase subunit F
MSNYDNEIVAYNKQLTDTLTKVDLTDYTTELHTRFYSNIDISFMEYFMELIKYKNQFVVEHEKLIEFGVITTTRSNDIKRQMDQYEFKDGKDYLLRNVAQQSESARGTKYTKKYTLTPNAFKKCLVRSKNTDKYADYYMFIEELQFYYKCYESDYNQKLSSIEIGTLKTELSTKDDKIDELTSIVKQTLETAKQSQDIAKQSQVTIKQNQEIITVQSKNIDRLMVYTEEIKEQLNLFTVLLSDICSIIMTDVYNNNVKQMKVLIMYVYRKDNDDKYYITFTYCQLSLLHIQIGKKLNISSICKFIVFKPLKDNLITIQYILEKLSVFYTVNKRSNTIMCNKDQKK